MDPADQTGSVGSQSGVLEQVNVTRYVTPLREGGSPSALVEADNLGTYVLNFRGAGQGPKPRLAEIISCELARRLGLSIPSWCWPTWTRIARGEPKPGDNRTCCAPAAGSTALDEGCRSATGRGAARRADPLADTVAQHDGAAQPAHSGLTVDTAAELTRVFDELVR
jgi:hypothetical protein